jgi:uncharacterized protein (TIGR02646 family)
MRGIGKPWPPGNVSPDGHLPRSLRDAELEYRGRLPTQDHPAAFARTEFDRLDKRKLRIVMYREQRALCVYCERRIEDGNPTPRVDHWRPLRLHPEIALHWRNLYLSCPSPETCEAAKGHQALRWNDGDDHMPWPADRRYEELVGFTSRGEMYVRKDVVLEDAARRALDLAIDDCPDGTRTRRAVLNLNHPALVAARAAALDSERLRLERDFEDRRASKDDRARRARDLTVGASLPPFVSIRVAWLRQMLGWGR